MRVTTVKPRAGHRPALRLAGFCLLATLVTPASRAAGTLEPYTETGSAPEISLNDTRGNLHTLEAYRGKVVLVNFWASWCPPCIKEMPGLQQLQERLADRPFTILAVNVGEKRYAVWKFTKLVDFTLPTPLDAQSRVFKAWGAEVLPTSFLLDTRGQIRYRVQGDLEWNSETVISLIEKLLAEESPDAE
ncbi:MAG TPA: TlpA disulfide reductase family protein [Gammaproteobacteria bacterium]|nr:TlpA disulfide reductase family protein [Gammaproteobacteria bacterium]